MKLYQIVCFIPVDYTETVKQAMFDAGGGKAGFYDHACWQCEGTGQFRPLEKSSAFIGRINEETRVSETRLEMICGKKYLKAVVNAMLKAHPYETPAFYVCKTVL